MESSAKEDKTMEKYAVMSEAAYEHYFSNNDVQHTNTFIQQYLPDYRLDPALSDNYSVVIANPENSDVVIAYRGTDLANLYDDFADLQLVASKPVGDIAGATASAATGLAAPVFDKVSTFITDGILGLGRMHNAALKYEAVRSSYPNSSISVTGHSLGGAQAAHVNALYNVPAYVYNAFDPNSSVKDIDNTNLYIYHSNYDVLSLETQNARVNYVPPKQMFKNYNILKYGLIGAAYNAHDIYNFIPEEPVLLEQITTRVPRVKPFATPQVSMKHQPFEHVTHRHFTRFECQRKDGKCVKYL